MPNTEIRARSRPRHNLTAMSDEMNRVFERFAGVIPPANSIMILAKLPKSRRRIAVLLSNDLLTIKLERKRER